MNFWLGLGLLILIAGTVLLFVGIGSDRYWMFGIGTLLIAAPLVLGGVAFALYLMGGGSLSHPLREGDCYRAVRHTTTTIIPVGKVFIPSTTSGIDLEEIRCP